MLWKKKYRGVQLILHYNAQDKMSAMQQPLQQQEMESMAMKITECWENGGPEKLPHLIAPFTLDSHAVERYVKRVVDVGGRDDVDVAELRICDVLDGLQYNDYWLRYMVDADIRPLFSDSGLLPLYELLLYCFHCLHVEEFRRSSRLQLAQVY